MTNRAKSTLSRDELAALAAQQTPQETAPQLQPAVFPEVTVVLSSEHHETLRHMLTLARISVTASLARAELEVAHPPGLNPSVEQAIASRDYWTKTLGALDELEAHLDSESAQ